jgi:hypothetical protein
VNTLQPSQSASGVMGLAGGTTMAGHTGAVLSLGASTDGSMLVSSSKDGTVRVWDCSNGQLIKTFNAHRGSVTAVLIMQRPLGLSLQRHETAPTPLTALKKFRVGTSSPIGFQTKLTPPLHQDSEMEPTRLVPLFGASSHTALDEDGPHCLHEEAMDTALHTVLDAGVSAPMRTSVDDLRSKISELEQENERLRTVGTNLLKLATKK